ncbi:tyrosine--tRNA ligase [Acidiluteibacter ferrifornacis]|uniref:Tyrosine--tRNA ligase n=1 Tax=Acidiluteibacter ferrifornacis TaxID=2692424 RepID=A0A6N9NHZ5_9FLAO|nr:tyrosine--tRNA ligase [Acidiluteibacter ferrifornacis]NBG65151.1 tyrosine--tRNA ligase [Acidiluteibacter ferrifornacis]
MNFVKELEWREMLHTSMPGVEEHLKEGMRSAYVGIDPTADSLHIGHLVSVMMLKHFQAAGHRPIALIGGATGMIGDPSGKSKERNLLDEETLRHNQESIKQQLARFLDFDSDAENAAKVVNNFDWMKDFSFLGFIRDVGKHITVNYMMAKDSVKKRLTAEDSEGMSFTEFTYQLVQGYDFLHLFNHEGCTLQMGGSDQWGNITTGTEMIRRIGNGKAFAITCPLITKSDGGKFGKTESGNIWLDADRTSPYVFYQFWMNVSDEDAAKYMRIFTLFSKDEIEELIKKHAEAPHLRALQSALAKDVTIRVHSEEDYNNAVAASNILFGKSTTQDLKKLSERDFLSIFEGVPQSDVDLSVIKDGLGIIELTAEKSDLFSSNGEARRMLKSNAVSLNKEKVDESKVVNSEDLLFGKYLILQKGKKNYYLISVS